MFFKTGRLPRASPNSATFIHSIFKKALKRLSGQVPNRLLRIFAAKDQKADIRVRPGIANDSLDSQIFRMKSAYNRKPIGHTISELPRNALAVESANRHRSLVSNDIVVPRKWRPSFTLDGLLSWTQVKSRGNFWEYLRKCVGRDCWVADGAAQAVVLLGLED